MLTGLAGWPGSAWPQALPAADPALATPLDAPALTRPTPPAPSAWQLTGTYQADWLHASAPRLHTALGNGVLRLDVDAAALLGWPGTLLHTERLLSQGGKPNCRVGTVQGLSHIEVTRNAVQLYATWIAQDIQATGTQRLFGRYDLNREFYATDASALLIHPSFGIGIDASQSGRNRPSIFPNLGLILRLRQPLGGGHYLQGALIDGVPGDPDRPGRTVVHLRRSDGTLRVAEAGWQAPGPASGGDGRPPGHWGLGLWQYSQPSPAIDGASPAPSHGVYGIAQGALFEQTVGFVRAGGASRRAHAVHLALAAGVWAAHPLGPGGPSHFSAGAAMARFGAPQQAAWAALGRRSAAHETALETALELGLPWQWRPGLALQPVLQQVWHPAGRSDRVWVSGLRIESAWGADAP